MRLGIRAKLVGTLLLAGILPLALALGVILFGAVELRINSKGQTYRALAQHEALRLSTILAQQIEIANLSNEQPGTADFLLAANRVPPLTQSQINVIESQWTLQRADEGVLAAALQNPLAQRWQSIVKSQARFSEVLVTDITGRLVAATNKTSDYYQADEKWWIACFDEGRGKTLISDVVFDASAIGSDGRTGSLVVDLCLPIHDSRQAKNRKVIGITKLSIDATWMLDQLDLGIHTDEFPRVTWLVKADGKPILGSRINTTLPMLSKKVTQKILAEQRGYVVDNNLIGNELIGFAVVEEARLMMDKENRWYVAVASSREEALSSIHRIAWIILAAGLIIILICFIGGMHIARREIIRPLLTLQQAVGQIKSGNTSYRLSEDRGGVCTFREDEIGTLAHDFNAMAGQLQENFNRLQQADEVKRQFIDLASHELRTPITYIQGVSQLAQRQDAQPNSIMARILSKSQRLSRIVENMFKLLSDEKVDKSLRRVEVDMPILIQSVCHEHDPFLAERKQTWDIRIAPDIPPLQADPEKLRDILSNLFSNAIRFSPDGGTIGVSAQKTKGDVEMVISDQGPGIPREDLPNIFQPFYTSSDVSKHSSGEYAHMTRGMGLGLSVVKRFVEMHGGGVSIDTSSTGTQFTIRLPIRPPKKPKSKPADESIVTGDSSVDGPAITPAPATPQDQTHGI